jgi:hypothetical protein
MAEADPAKAKILCRFATSYCEDMNEAHLHLLVNHIPIVGGGLAVLILAWGLIRKNKSIVQLALGLLVLVGIASLVADLTGEGAEEVVEHSGVAFNHDAIHEHEEAAFFANMAAMLTGIVALVTLAVRKLRDGKVMPIVVLVLAVWATATMVRTGYLGGFIVHTEVHGAGGDQEHNQH